MALYWPYICAEVFEPERCCWMGCVGRDILVENLLEAVLWDGHSEPVGYGEDEGEPCSIVLVNFYHF
jgi:hypothetical protein